MAGAVGARRHQNVKLTLRILFLVNFNLFGAGREVRSGSLLLIFVGCVGWRDAGLCSAVVRSGHGTLPSDVSLVTVATQWSGPVLTSSMINNQSVYYFTSS